MNPIAPLDPDSDESDELQQQFYTAVMASQPPSEATTGSPPLDVLLQKGLYGSRLPKPLKGQKAADAFQTAFDLIGGIPRLALWADKNPTQFFSLYSKLIPSTVKASVDATIKIDAPWMSPNRLSYMDSPQVIDVTPTDPEPSDG